MKKIAALTLALLLCGLFGLHLLGCGDEESADNHTVLRSQKQRATPSIAGSDLAVQVAGNNAFGMDVYNKVAEPGKNLFISPHSLTSALAMLYGGARGNTAAAMKKAMHLSLSDDKVHQAFNKLDLELASRGEGAQAADGGPFRLTVNNALWGEQTHSFLPSFIDLLGVNYGAGMHLLDFVGAPEVSRGIINTWVSDKTEGRIPDLMPPGSVARDTKLVLTNAVYLNAAWHKPFKKSNTRPGTFDADGSPVTTPMMHTTQTLAYAKGQGYQAVELPYDGQELSMVIIVPDKGTFRSFQSKVSWSTVEGAIASLASKEVVLSMPSFTFKAAYELNKPLQELGMSAIFSGADFSGIDGGYGMLRVSKVVHKTFILVNEEGSEAAGATGISMDGGVALPPDQVVLNVDRPFLFLIRDRLTRAVLFLGHVVDPSGK